MLATERSKSRSRTVSASAKGLLDIVGGETDADAGADGLRW
jgi:hypothetical protein